MHLFFLILIIIFVIIELITFNLITIWMAIGSVAGFITSYITSNETIQLTAFFTVTVISLILTRPLVKKFKQNVVEFNLDVKGKIGVVTEDIEPLVNGRIKLEGKYWSAKSNQTIPKSSKVKILGIEGVKLIVEKEN